MFGGDRGDLAVLDGDVADGVILFFGSMTCPPLSEEVELEARLGRLRRSGRGGLRLRRGERRGREQDSEGDGANRPVVNHDVPILLIPCHTPTVLDIVPPLRCSQLTPMLTRGLAVYLSPW